jgi:hypothetical protein
MLATKRSAVASERLAATVKALLVYISSVLLPFRY